jgi:4-aminobutyrate aminotransferase-like enzyme
MVGVELAAGSEPERTDGVVAQAVQARAFELGLLLLTCGPRHEVVRWIPPLDATAAEIAEGLETFGEALRTL